MSAAARALPAARSGRADVLTLAAFGLLYALVVVFGFGGWRGEWCCDDTQILAHALHFEPWRYFADPIAWRALVPFSLTPWLSLSYRVDLGLFGLAPAGFYLHHRLALAGCATLIHALLWRRSGHAVAAAAALLFLAGVPVAQASALLMVRHYVEGLLALLLCLGLVQQQAQQPRAWRAWLVGLSFALAASAKEIYLPLGLTTLLLAHGSPRQRLHTTAPVLLVMLLYVPWRLYMLGDLLGGYTPAGELSAAHLLTSAWQAGAALPALLLGRPQPALAAIAVLVLALFVAGAKPFATSAHQAAQQAAQSRGATLLCRVATVLAILALLLLPLLPLTVYPGLGRGSERYFFAPWAALAIAVGCAALPLQRRWPRAGPALVVATATVLALSAWPLARQSLRETAAMQREFGAHFEALTLGGADDVVIVAPSVAAWFVTGALALRPALGRSDTVPGVAVDDAELLGLIDRKGRMLHYDVALGRMTDARAAVQARLAAWRQHLRPRPMSVVMSYDGPARVLRWQLRAPTQTQAQAPSAGGAARGRFSLIGGGQRLDVPMPEGALRMEQALPACFRIRHDDADGSIAYTPWLRLAMTHDRRSTLRWSGQADDLPALARAPGCPTPSATDEGSGQSPP